MKYLKGILDKGEIMAGGQWKDIRAPQDPDWLCISVSYKAFLLLCQYSRYRLGKAAILLIDHQALSDQTHSPSCHISCREKDYFHVDKLVPTGVDNVTWVQSDVKLLY